MDVKRDYVLGLGRSELDPGAECCCEGGVVAPIDFDASKILVFEDFRCFEVVRVTVNGANVPVDFARRREPFGDGVSTPVDYKVKKGQLVEVVVRNASSSRAKVVVVVWGETSWRHENEVREGRDND